MKLNSFEEISKLDSELAGLFLRPEVAVKWIYAMEKGIKGWICKHNKQYWEVVRFVSERRGILGNQRRDRKTIFLSRENFAKVLLKFCPDVVNKDESISALVSSMEHFVYNNDLRSFDKLNSGNIALRYCKEVESILDNMPMPKSCEGENKPTLEDLVVQYLRREVEDQECKFPCSIVRIRKNYEYISPAISVETYKSEMFLKNDTPTHIEAYEFVYGVLQKPKLFEILGKYSGKAKFKLFIVSTSGLLPEIRKLAIENGIGYIRLNTNEKMSSNNYVLPRSVEDYAKQRHNLDVLLGLKTMTTPLLIMDGYSLKTSLADFLSDNEVAVKRQRLLNIPYLSETEIEQRTIDLIYEEIETKYQMMKTYQSLAYPSIDPFTIAKSNGLSYETNMIDEDSQLGCFNVKTKHVILNSKGLDNYQRYRFTMAHELGHYILHSKLFRKHGVESVGESDNTLSISKSDLSKLEIQANKFASFLLMPTKLVKYMFAYYYLKNVIQVYGNNNRPLYYNPRQPETFQSYNNIVGNLAQIFEVSLQAMTVRLKSLRLLKTPDNY